MYVKSDCPYGYKTCYHNICFRIKKEIMFDGKEYTEHKSIKDIEVTDTVSEEEFACCIIRELRPHMHNGMTTGEFCKILKDNFGVASTNCCDLIQRMKVELDMYSPDCHHLFFVA